MAVRVLVGVPVRVTVGVRVGVPVIVGVFVVTWVVALAVWHFGKIEQKWEAAAEGPQD